MKSQRDNAQQTDVPADEMLNLDRAFDEDWDANHNPHRFEGIVATHDKLRVRCMSNYL